MHAVQAGPVSAVSEKLKFSEPVKTGTTGILPKVKCATPPSHAHQSSHKSGQIAACLCSAYPFGRVP